MESQEDTRTTQKSSSRVVARPRRGGRPPHPHIGRLGREVLLLFFFFVLLTLLVTLALTAYAARRQVQDARSLQTRMAQWTANALDGWLQDLDANLAATTPLLAELLDASRAEVQRNLSGILLRSPTFRSVTLVDARPRHRGNEILTLDVNRNVITGTNLYDQEWFAPALERGHYVSQVSYVQGMPTFTVAHSILREGQPAGIIAAQVDLSWGYTILRRSSIEERGAYAYIVDNNSRLILHGDTPLVMARGVYTDNPGVHAAISQLETPLYYPGVNSAGDQVIGAYRRLNEVNWTVIAEQPILPVVNELLPLAIGAAVILVLSLLAAAVISLYITRRVARPIASLQDGARRIGTGDLDHRIGLRGENELTDLADEFNRMAAGLRESHARQEAWSHELEDRVQERTTELTQTLDQLQEESRTKENLLLLVKEMSSPVIPVMEGIIVIPIVGALDSERAQRVMDDLLAGVDRVKARVTIIDITGLAVVDTAVANALLQASRAVQLLGAHPILVGIAPEVAETLVQLGVEIRHIRTAATLQEGLQMALAMLRRKVVSV